MFTLYVYMSNLELLKIFYHKKSAKGTFTELIFNLYFWHRFGLANAINNYLRLKIPDSQQKFLISLAI